MQRTRFTVLNFWGRARTQGWYFLAVGLSLSVAGFIQRECCFDCNNHLAGRNDRTAAIISWPETDVCTLIRRTRLCARSSRPIVALNGLFSARAHDLTRHIMAQGRAAHAHKNKSLSCISLANRQKQGEWHVNKFQGVENALEPKALRA
jgi:hypothetical protein